MQVVTQITARVEHAHVDHGNLGALGNPCRDDGRDRIVEGLDVGIETRLLRLDDLGYDDNSIRHCLEDVVDQLSEPLGCLRVRFRSGVSSVQVIGTCMKQDHVGLKSQTSSSNTADLTDSVAREALVIFVCHGARLLRSNKINAVTSGLQVGEKSLAIAIGSTSVNETPRDGVAERQNPETLCLT